jgi:RsmE family RNA methyltransferase
MYFYIPSLNQNKVYFPDSAHLFSMRVQVGETCQVTDLKGNLAQIKILKIEKKEKSVEFEIIQKNTESNYLNKTLIQAIPDKVYLEKLVEILPLAKVKTCYLFWSDRSVEYTINWERLNGILTRSCEQSQSCFKPKFEVIKSLDELNGVLNEYKPLVLECENMATIKIEEAKKLVQQDYKPLLVGPEGGWSAKEINNFRNQKLDFVHLGELVYPSWLAGFGILS